ncbi:Protein of unknown function [Gryllus bimaculatus]|nr:Protein of unknown function [Gryllus bimaculatus]
MPRRGSCFPFFSLLRPHPTPPHPIYTALETRGPLPPIDVRRRKCWPQRTKRGGFPVFIFKRCATLAARYCPLEGDAAVVRGCILLTDSFQNEGCTEVLRIIISRFSSLNIPQRHQRSDPRSTNGEIQLLPPRVELWTKEGSSQPVPPPPQPSSSASERRVSAPRAAPLFSRATATTATTQRGAPAQTNEERSRIKSKSLRNGEN